MFAPYGKVTVLDANGTPRTVNESAYGNPWTFTGRRLDQETGLMQFRARMYSPDLGRFVSRDPIDAIENHGNVGAYSEQVDLAFALRRTRGVTQAFAQNRVFGVWQDPPNSVVVTCLFGLYSLTQNKPDRHLDPTGLLQACCVNTFAITDLGIPAPGRPLSRQFDMDATFKNNGTNSAGISCCCKCCEYRQFVMGYFKTSADWIPWWSTIEHELGPSGTMSENTLKEDQSGQPGRDPTNQPYNYGHRSLPAWPDDIYDQPNRAAGCHYRGHDAPGFGAPVPKYAKFYLVFVARIIDTCVSSTGAAVMQQIKFTISGSNGGGTGVIPKDGLSL